MVELSAEASRAAEAFRHDPKSRRVLREVYSGRREFMPAELFVAPVIAFLGEDPRSWRDWTEAVCEGANLVIHEEGWRRRKRRRRRVFL